nr:hypothetical protein [Tanacetum cinerariifolium]
MKKKNERSKLASGMHCNTLSDDYQFNADSERPLVQREFTTPLEEVSLRFEALATDVENVSASKNVRRCLLASHSSMPINASVLSGTTELRLGPTYTIENRGITGKNTVHTSRVFDRFKNMRMDNIEANSMTHTAICKQQLPTMTLPCTSVDRREALNEVTETVIATSNVRRNMRMDNIEANSMTHTDGGNQSKFGWDETDLVRLATGPDLVRLETGPDLNMETDLVYHQTEPI